MDRFYNRHDRRLHKRLSPVSRRVVLAGIICLFGLFSRYTVFLGHDCEQLNPWLAPSEEKTALTDAEHLILCGATPSAAPESTHHDHDNCPICETYDQIVYTLPSIENPTELQVLSRFIGKRFDFAPIFVENPVPFTHYTRGPPRFA